MRGSSRDYDESDVRIRPNRRGSRPRTKDRPKHADAITARVVSVDRGRWRTVVAEGTAEQRAVTAMRARELGRSPIVPGDLVGLVAGHEQKPLQLPSRSSDGHLELLLRTAQQATTTASGEADSAWLLERAFRVTARPTLMTIITDEAHPTVEDFTLLRRLTTRHDVMVIRIADADPLQRDALEDDVVDVDAPREVASLARTSTRVAHDVRAYRDARREGIAEMLDRLHITHLLTQGETTVVDDMIALLRSREYRHARS